MTTNEGNKVITITYDISVDQSILHYGIPSNVTIGKRTFELQLFPSAPELEQLTEEARIKLLGNLITQNAHGILNHFSASSEWFAGVIVAASFLEFLGKARLMWRLKPTISYKKIEDMKLDDVITMLCVAEIIDQPTYAKMSQIRNFRNDIAHKINIACNLLAQERKAVERAKNILKHTHTCLDVLAPAQANQDSEKRTTGEIETTLLAVAKKK